jgi:hypothetical protein
MTKAKSKRTRRIKTRKSKKRNTRKSALTNKKRFRGGQPDEVDVNMLIKNLHNWLLELKNEKFKESPPVNNESEKSEYDSQWSTTDESEKSGYDSQWSTTDESEKSTDGSEGSTTDESEKSTDESQGSTDESRGSELAKPRKSRFLYRPTGFEVPYCFLSGAYVLEDPGHRFYNIFAHGKNVTTCLKDVELSDNVKAHSTSTHNHYQKGDYSIDTNCSQGEKVRLKELYKLERILEDGGLHFLCGDEGNENNRETKRVVLFYPFVKKDDPMPYLFLKFEENKMISREHVFALLNKKRHNTFPIRREGTENMEQYTRLVSINDKKFYEKIKAPEKLKKYNEEMRSGAEMFLSSEALDNFMTKFPIPLKN